MARIPSALEIVLSVALVIAAVVALFTLLPACSAIPPHPDPKPPAPIPDPPDDAGATACQRADARLAALQCRDRQGRALWQTPNGTPFAEVCEDAMVDGRDYHPDQIARIQSCAEFERAYRGDLP